jgi:hypothetical protein
MPVRYDRQQMKERIKRWGAVAGLLLIGLVAALWLARDLPRQQVETILAARLDGKVRVGKLIVHGTRRFELCDLTVDHPGVLPQVSSLAIERAVAVGSLADIRAGRLDGLSLTGATLTLDPHGKPAEVIAGEPPSVGQLEIEQALVLLSAAESAGRITVTAELHDVGSEQLSGEATLRSDQACLSEVADLVGTTAPVDSCLDGLQASLTISNPDRLQATVTAEQLDLAAGGQTLSLGELHAQVTAEREPQSGSLSVRVDPRLHGVDTAAVNAVWQPDGGLEQLQARISGLQLDHWLAMTSLLPAGWQVDGTVEVEAVASAEGGLQWQARARLDQVVAALDETRVTVGGTTAADGTLKAGTAGTVHATWQLAQQTDGGSLWLPPVAGELTAEVTASAVSGDLELGILPGRRLLVTGAIGLAQEQPQVAVDWRLERCRLAELLDLVEPLGLQLPDGVVAAEVEAAGTMSGRLAGPTVAGRVVLDRASLSHPDGGRLLEAGRITTDLSWRLPDRVLGLDVDLPGVSVKLPGLARFETTVAATVEADLQSFDLALTSLAIDSGQLGGVTGRGHWSAMGIWSAQLAVSEVGLAKWLGLLSPELLPGDLATIKGSGTATELTINGSADAVTAEGRLTLSDVGYSSDDGTRVVEGLALRSRARLTVEPHQAARLQAQGSVTGPLLLWDTVFADLSERQAGLTVTAQLDLEPTEPAWSMQMHGSFDPGASLFLSLSGGADLATRWQSQLQVNDLEASFETWIREPLQGSVPAIEPLLLEGAASARLTGSRSSVSGRLELDRLTMGSAGGSFELDDLSLQLPLDLSWRHGAGGRLELSGRPGHGRLGFDSLMAAGLTMPATSVPLVIRGDTVTVEDRLSLPLLGGQVHLDQLTLAELLRPQRRLETAVRLDRISLAEISEALDIVPLVGELQGAFSKILLTGTSLRVEGDGQLAMFGGMVTVSDISGSNILSRFPRLELSSRFSDIDLAQLTGTFDFGEMSGVMAGEINDCELFRGIPVRCSGRVETVPTPGVKQTISLKAVNNIAIIGTGGEVSLLDRGIHRFLRRYSYQRIGFEMDLDQDRFLLRGLERRGDRELFLKGRWPFRIDVVNMQPGAAVSFQTMLERLRTLDISAVHLGSAQK